ncbi:TPA: type II toxin-antitoxin system VapC family toxin, partial [Streptococcus equi subsp. equi]|nr:type II toxin-antitoxin system VapC family toxin [Streptococcus equi subsp. equi]
MAINVSLASYNVKERESFIVDTNVWIYLFSPFSASTHGYDIFLADTQKKNCKLFVNSQIISEYVNVICRTAYQQYLRTNHLQQRNFKFKKDYQKTSDFDRYYKIAIDSVQNDILKHSKIIPI